MKPLAGFQSLETHHCVTGSMRHLYVYNDHGISEEVLLGLGAGVGFSYWHFKGQPPFLGGRVMPKPSMEEIAGQRTGVGIQTHTTTSLRKAEKTLLEMLNAGQPVMVQCDMGFLPYFDFGGQEYHFGGHVVVVCGYDPDTNQVLVADRDEELYPVSMEDLARARGSTFKPFPPKNLWYTFDFAHKRQPTADEALQAILEQAGPMLEPPITNIGVKGIRKASKMLPRWPDRMEVDGIRFALFNTWIFVSPQGGSGGGCFRYMFSRFLREAAGIVGDARLADSATEFWEIGNRWQELAEWALQASEAPDPIPLLPEAAPRLATLAGLEEQAWTTLRDISSE